MSLNVPISEARPEPDPDMRFVATIEVDGRPLQAVTELWSQKPTGKPSWRNAEVGGWLTSHIYDPITRELYWPSGGN